MPTNLSSPLFFLKSLEGPKPLQEKDILLKGKYQYKDRNRTRIRRKLRKKKLRKKMLSFFMITTNFGSICGNLQSNSLWLLTKLRPFLC